MEAYKLSQSEVGVSKHIHLTHLNAPTIFEQDNGQIGCTLAVQGVPFDTATNEELNSYKRSIHHAISVLGEEFCVYETTLRRKMDIHLDGEFKEDFTRDVNEKYHAQFKQTNLYANELYITLLYKGIDSGKVSKTLNVFQKLMNKAVKTARDEYRNQAIRRLEKAAEQFMAIIARFKPRLLGARDKTLGYSELLTFHGVFVNGLDTIPFRVPTQAAPMASHLDGALKAIELYPQGNIANYLPAKRLFFGDYIEFKGASHQSKFGAMLSLKEYGTETAAIMLDPLLHLAGEFIYTNSFAIEPNELAQRKIVRQLVRLENANDPAVSQMQELAQCRDDLSSGRLKVGYHHNTLMLLSEDLEQLQQLVNKAIKLYSDIGFVAFQETIGMEAAFWSQLPGNQKYVIRSSLITSQNFVDFCPLHNYRTGYRDRNHLGSAVTLIETPSKTPMFFNYHAKGSGDRNDLTPGHTTIIGGNGSGKTVFMGFMDSQMSRYGGRSFFFDRDRGMEIYVRAAGGVYSIINPDYPDDVQFNPLWLEDTPKNRAFLKDWLAQLIKEEGEEELPGNIDQQVSDCIDYAYDALSKAHRNLTTATRILPIDFPRWDRLRKWLRGDATRHDGEYAYLFDNDEDKLDLSISKLGFDFTDLMNQPSQVLAAVSMYLVHQIEGSLDGQRVSIYLDEAWQMLDNPYWAKQLNKDFATFRKLNAHFVLATQSPESVVTTSISAKILDNCATNIFFCNSKANYDKDYRHFNVTLSEFDFIKNTPREKRLFLYKQSEDSAICKLNLSGMDDALAVYSANKSTIQLLDALRQQVGNDPAHWLPLFHQKRKQLREAV